MKIEKIGLCLSGGGIRAAIFHLGALKFLAEQGRLEHVTFISTVSGGSLATGLIYGQNHGQWPTSERYLQMLPQMKSLILGSTLQYKFIIASLKRLHVFLRGRASHLSYFLKEDWKIDLKLSDLPEKNPRWIINATCYETGKNWSFSPKKMGDYVSGYVKTPNIPLADCLAASAAVPGLIGPLHLKTDSYSWFNFAGTQEIPITPEFKELKLWDGGVYDNLGIEPLFKIHGGYRDDVDFLIASDASAKMKKSSSIFQKSFPFYAPPLRLLDTACEQIRGLRVRSLVNHFIKNPEAGALISIGNSIEDIVKKCTVKHNYTVPTKSLTEAQVRIAGDYKTTLTAPDECSFDLLFQHGYEVASATLKCYCPNKFKHEGDIAP